MFRRRTCPGLLAFRALVARSERLGKDGRGNGTGQECHSGDSWPVGLLQWAVSQALLDAGSVDAPNRVAVDSA
jgi:hypothetical protein